jgi:uridine kinase
MYESRRVPLFVGIAGGTGSGKTTVARNIAAALPPEQVVVLPHDAYYKPHPNLSTEEQSQLNFDHPSALDNELLATHLDTLRAGQPIELPVYDFTKHVRQRESLHIPPAPVIIVEGILVLTDPRIRARLSIRVFVETDADIRVFRRIRSDIETRGRTFEQVRQQYYQTVRPMHLEFVEPSRRFADLIIPEGGENAVALDLLVAKLRSVLS